LAWGFAIDTRYAVGILALGSAVRYDDGALILALRAKINAQKESNSLLP